MLHVLVIIIVCYNVSRILILLKGWEI